MTRRFTCPEDQLTAEINFAIAYAVACEQDRARYFLISEPEGSRGYLAGQIAAMLLERAENGLSGMAVTGEVEAPASTGRPGPELSARAADVTRRVLAILSSGDCMSTQEIMQAVGDAGRQGSMAYTVLKRLARHGDVEKTEVPGKRARYWQRVSTEAKVPGQGELA